MEENRSSENNTSQFIVIYYQHSHIRVISGHTWYVVLTSQLWKLSGLHSSFTLLPGLFMCDTSPTTMEHVQHLNAFLQIYCNGQPSDAGFFFSDVILPGNFFKLYIYMYVTYYFLDSSFIPLHYIRLLYLESSSYGYRYSNADVKKFVSRNATAKQKQQHHFFQTSL